MPRSHASEPRCASSPGSSRSTRRPPEKPSRPVMADSGGRSSRGSGSFTVHLAEELEVYFNEVAHGRPVGFVASSKWKPTGRPCRSEEHTSELQSQSNLVCRLLLEKKKKT